MTSRLDTGAPDVSSGGGLSALHPSRSATAGPSQTGTRSTAAAPSAPHKRDMPARDEHPSTSVARAASPMIPAGLGSMRSHSPLPQATVRRLSASMSQLNMSVSPDAMGSSWQHMAGVLCVHTRMYVAIIHVHEP